MGKSYIGLDIGGTNIKTAVINEKNQISIKHIEFINKTGSDQALQQILEITQGLIQQANEVLAIGIGLPGIIDSKTGIMVQSPNLAHLENLDLKKICTEKFGIPVHIDNDVNISAFAEYKMHPEIVRNNLKNILFMMVGTGLGGGIILDGKLWRGSSGFAAELGHICVDLHGDKCNCGGKGCLETYVSSTGLIRRTKKHLLRFPTSTLSRISSDKLNCEDIFEAEKNNDPAAVYLIQEFIEALSAGVGSLINIFNPEAIVLGGGVLIPNYCIVEQVSKKAENYSFHKPYKDCIIIPSHLKNEAGVIGAALLAKNFSE